MKQKIKQIFYWFFAGIAYVAFWPTFLSAWLFDEPGDVPITAMGSILLNCFWLFFLVQLLFGKTSGG